MRGDVVPDGDHVTRLCGRIFIQENGMPDGSAFVRKPGETYLSVNWLECLPLASQAEQIAEVLRVLELKRHVGRTAKLALLNVGRSRMFVRQGTPNNPEIHFLHEPTRHPHVDPSHSGIHELPGDQPGLVAAQQLAYCVLAVFPT